MSKLCECGCGREITSIYKGEYRRFIRGHSQRGRQLSEETKKKIKENHADTSGNKNPMYGKTGEQCYWFGKHLSENTKKKLSLAMSGENHPFYGKHHTKERKDSMSGQGNPMYGKPVAIGAGRGKYSICNAGYWVRSSYERKFSDGMYFRDIKHEYEPERFQLGGGLSFLPDYLIPELNLYIELKGYMDTKSKIRHELFRRQGHKLLVLDKKFFGEDRLFEQVLNELGECIQAKTLNDQLREERQ